MTLVMRKPADDPTAMLAADRLCILIDPVAGRGIFAARARQLDETQATMMATLGRGILSVALEMPAAFRLGIGYMAGSRLPADGAPVYLTSIEAAGCRGSGISAADRAQTIRMAGDPASGAANVVTPGHILPLLLRRLPAAGATLPEWAYALIAGDRDCAALAWCDILGDEGDTASLDHCHALSLRAGLPIFAVGR